MKDSKKPETTYRCPMHRDVRQPNPGKCPRCGMDLLAEGAPFGLLRHMAQAPMMRIAMAALIAAILATLMALMS